MYPASMALLLRALAKMSPQRLFLSCWAVLLVLLLLGRVPILRGFAAAGMLAVFCGYPYMLTLGLPQGVVRRGVKDWARRLFLGFCSLLLLLTIVMPLVPGGYSTPKNPHSLREWIEFIAGLAAIVVIFAPFLLGSAALNDLRRSTGQNPTLDSLPNFLALYFGLFGGLLYVHRRVREALSAC